MAVEKELEKMRRQLEYVQGEISGTLNAGISINFAQYRLPDILAGYHRSYPLVNLQITTGQSRHLYRQMMEGSLDLALLRGEYAWEGIRILLSQENICLICNREYEHTPLSDYLYIGRETDSVQAAMIARFLHEQGLNQSSRGFSVDSITACVEMVKRGLGWGLVPEIALDHFEGCIRPCSFENGEPLTRRTYVLCQREAAKLPQVQAFLEMLRKS